MLLLLDGWRRLATMRDTVKIISRYCGISLRTDWISTDPCQPQVVLRENSIVALRRHRAALYA